MTPLDVNVSHYKTSKVMVFWDVISCSLKDGYGSFQETCCCQCRKGGGFLQNVVVQAGNN